MATISSSLKLNDAMSRPLQSIVKAMNSTLTAIRSIEDADLGSEFAQAAADVRLAEQALDEMNRGLQESASAASNTSGGFTIMRGALSGLVVNGINMAVNALKNFSSEMVTVAAAVRAEESMFSQTFGGLSDTATEAIGRIADTAGILDTRLNVAGSRIYSFARSSGADTASAMSLMEEALMASADSAAYYDKSLEETTDTLMSFLKGNYANDAALGVSATEATRNAKAVEQFGKNYGKLTEIQKQQTLLKMVTDSQKLSGAMGQAAREADGWENVVGNLNETWRQFMAAIGEPVLDALIPIIKALASGIQFLSDNLETVTSIIVGVISGIAAAAIAFGVYTVVQWVATGAAQAFFATLLANPLVWIALAIGVVVGMIYKWIQSVGGIQIAWAIVRDYLLMAWDSLKIGFQAFVDTIMTFWENLKIAFFTGVVYVQNLFDSLKLAIASVGVAIADKMGSMKVSVLTILQDMVNDAIGIINNFISAVSGVLDIGIQAIAEVEFATTAAADEEVAKAGRKAALDAQTQEISGAMAGREASLAKMQQDAVWDQLKRQEAIDTAAAEARTAHTERQTNIAARQAEIAAETAANTAGINDGINNLTSGSGSGSEMKTTGDVEISGEDIQLLLDLSTAAAKITYQTLTPAISLTIGTVRETVDVDHVVSEISYALEEATQASVVIT